MKKEAVAFKFEIWGEPWFKERRENISMYYKINNGWVKKCKYSY